MSKIMEFLDGYKTYIQAAMGAVVVGLNFAGIINQEMMVSFLAMLGLGMGASLRAGIKKSK